MIEREFVQQQKKEFQIQEFVSATLKNAGHSHTKLQRTPLGEKVVIYTSRPGLIVGRKGQTISKLTEILKKKFGLENPQVEIAEVSNPNLDSRIVAERIASELERFGANRFKGIMHKAVEDVLASGAIGVELRLSGKLPGARAKSWRVAGGYLRKCGDAAVSFVKKTILSAQLKPGVIGIQVRIMPSGIVMPDEIKLKESEAPAAAVVQQTQAAGETASIGQGASVVSETSEPTTAKETTEAGAEVKTTAQAAGEDSKPAKKARAPRKKPEAAKKKEEPEAAAASEGQAEADK
ncbi:MAG TPA: 30S ribosomal protein S3 [Candidatus Nanoarchaeia archaeon]|nr:30S ribosomal protein S3 [Candidatus Nanoarchaeia archaeon]